MKFNEFKETVWPLLKNGGSTQSEICKETGSTISSAKRWMAQLVSEGSVVKNGPLYTLPGSPVESVKASVNFAEPVKEEKVAIVRSAPTGTVVAFPVPANLPSYKQEPQAEKIWSFILRNENVSDSMENPDHIKSMAGNWRYFAASLDLCEKGLMGVPEVSAQFQQYLVAKKAKNFETIGIQDLQVFVADKIWESKLQNDAILNPALLSMARFWQQDRRLRGRLHEALIKSGKWFLEEVVGLLRLTGVDVGGVDVRQYLNEYGKRQAMHLDEILKDRQAEAKQIIAAEISDVVNPQLPEAE